VRTLHPCSSAGLRLSSDASDGGLGAIVHRRSGNLVAARRLDERERAGSSTARELQGILFAVESFAWALTGKRAVLQCDNQGAVAITSKGSPKGNLNSIAIALANKCSEINCDLKVVWVPRELNVEADEASRLEDLDNWGIQPSVFRVCETKWGKFSVDRFADHENALCPRFNSKYFVPGTEAVDCFAETWSSDFNWVVPPVALIAPAVQFMLANKAEGVLGIPEWPSSPFFALLVNASGEWKPFIKGVLSFPVGTKIFRPDRDPCSAFRQPFSNFPFLFLRI
jgi:hypothetical protein